jgi:hypothetical protein
VWNFSITVSSNMDKFISLQTKSCSLSYTLLSIQSKSLDFGLDFCLLWTIIISYKKHESQVLLWVMTLLLSFHTWWDACAEPQVFLPYCIVWKQGAKLLFSPLLVIKSSFILSSQLANSTFNVTCYNSN